MFWAECQAPFEKIFHYISNETENVAKMGERKSFKIIFFCKKNFGMTGGGKRSSD
jgi:hypothetical protein